MSDEMKKVVRLVSKEEKALIEGFDAALDAIEPLCRSLARAHGPAPVIMALTAILAAQAQVKDGEKKLNIIIKNLRSFPGMDP